MYFYFIDPTGPVSTLMHAVVPLFESEKQNISWMKPSQLIGNQENLLTYKLTFCLYNHSMKTESKCESKLLMYNITSYILTGLLANQEYSYKVIAINAEGDESDVMKSFFNTAQCNTNMFTCLSGGKCVNKTKVCDATFDCGDKSDEAMSAGCSKFWFCL